MAPLLCWRRREVSAPAVDRREVVELISRLQIFILSKPSEGRLVLDWLDQMLRDAPQ
jgi:hypothetical protein